MLWWGLDGWVSCLWVLWLLWLLLLSLATPVDALSCRLLRMMSSLLIGQLQLTAGGLSGTACQWQLQDSSQQQQRQQRRWQKRQLLSGRVPMYCTAHSARMATLLSWGASGAQN